MTALATLQPARATAYSAKLYAAYRVDDRRTVRLPLHGLPATLREALNAAVVHCQHKDRLVIRETDDDTGSVLLHVYAIKQKARADWIYENHVPTRVQRLYAEPVCVVDGSVLS